MSYVLTNQKTYLIKRLQLYKLLEHSLGQLLFLPPLNTQHLQDE